MHKNRLTTLTLATLLAAGISFTAGCDGEDEVSTNLEQAGENIGEAAEAAGEDLQNAGTEVREQVEKGLEEAEQELDEAGDEMGGAQVIITNDPVAQAPQHKIAPQAVAAPETSPVFPGDFGMNKDGGVFNKN